MDAPSGYLSDGENMLPAWKGEAQTRTKPVFWWWQGKHSGDDWPAFAMRDGPWVLILDENKQREELYNVILDRTQTNNLAAERSERVASMREAIEGWFAELPQTVDPALQSKNPPAEPAAKKTQQPTDRGVVFTRWDKNHDQILTLEEYRGGLANKERAESRFRNFDKNGDGQLSRDEFVSPPNQ